METVCVVWAALFPLCCALLGDFAVEQLRKAAVRYGDLPEALPLPGLHWFGASLGALFVISLPLVLAALLLPGGSWRWDVFAVICLAGMFGAVADIPLSFVRNVRARRSGWWIGLEPLGLLFLATLLWCGFLASYREATRPGTWGALG